MSSSRSPSLPHLPRQSVVVLVASLLSASALAGTVRIHDGENLLSPADSSALQAAGASYPFDVRVLTNSEHSADFDRYVGEQVTEPKLVVIGIDRAHRHTSVHFGTGARIAPSEFHAIEQAGNASFRNGDWRGGIDAILSRAKESVGTASGVVAGSPLAERGAPPARQSTGGFPFGWLVLGGAVVVVFLIMRRAVAGGSGGGYQPPNVLPGPGYPGYGPGPGYGGGSGIGSSILSAGLGGLAGYELGKAMEGREGPREAGMLGSNPTEERDSTSSDDGGASGGWDDDQGGGGSDWGGGDSGGSGDGW